MEKVTTALRLGFLELTEATVVTTFMSHPDDR